MSKQMAKYDWATPSFSMKKQLHRRLRMALPRHGDRSKLVARLIEMYLDNQISQLDLNLKLRSCDTSVAVSNT